MIKITQKGEFNKTSKFLNFISNGEYLRKRLDEYGKKGVQALKDATPKDTGKTSESWSYEIDYGSDGASITWTNSNENHGVPIVILIQYGHATRGGTYVTGIDFINPAMKPIFDDLSKAIWKEVTSA